MVTTGASTRSFCADYSFRWVLPLIREGYFSALHEAKVPPVPADLSAGVCLRRVEATWKHEQTRAAVEKRSPHLEVAFFNAHRSDILIGSVAGVVAGLCNTVGKPLLLRVLIAGIADGEESAQLWRIFGCVCVTLMLESVAFVVGRHAIADRLLVGFSASFSGLVQAASLRVSTVQLAGSPDLGNLISSDLARINGYMLSLALGTQAVTSFVAGLFVLIYTIGLAGLVGLVPMLMMLGISFLIARSAKKAERVNLACTDTRMGLMSQTIHGMRAIKFCAWEDSFSDLITEARRKECIPLKTFRVATQGCVQLGRANPYIGAVFAFVFLALSSRRDPGSFRPADVFAAMNVFLSLRVPLIIIPELYVYVTSIRTSLARLQCVLDIPPAACYWQEGSKGSEVESCIRVQDSLFMWPMGAQAEQEPERVSTGRHSLQQGSPLMIDKLDVPRGCLCAVVGSVASGKTSLMSAILGEMPQVNQGLPTDAVTVSAQSLACAPQKVTVSARSLVFVPQKAFVLSGTVRDNIILGDESPDEDRLRLALQRSALEKDLESLANGQLTEVGERGIVLSGGQQQRISIARAFYKKEADLLLADDPLSALDTTVAQQVFQGFLAYAREAGGSNTCVIVLNQLQLLPYFDHVVVLSKGRIVESGPPSTVLSLNGVLAELCDSAGCLSSMALAPLPLKPILLQNKQPDDTVHGDDRDSVEKEEGGHSVALKSPDEGPGHIPEALVQDEEMLVGAMPLSVILRYIRGMGYHWFAFCMLCVVACYSSMAFTDYWLALWVQARTEAVREGRHADDNFYVAIYGCSSVTFLVLLWIASYCFSAGGVRSSRNLHKECLNAILHAPISFFEATPSGRITSRFSSDLACVDAVIPKWVDNLVQILATAVTIAIQVAVVVPAMIPVVSACYVIYCWLVAIINRTNRELRRYANSAASPMLTTLNESGNGRLVLRAMEGEDSFRLRFCQQTDEHHRFSYASASVVTGGQSVVYLISFVITCCTAALIISSREKYTPSMAALALTYTFLVPYFLNIFAMLFQFLLNSLTSLERLLQYGQGGIVPEEAAAHLPMELPSNSSWPSDGRVNFEAVSLVYRPGLPKSLDRVSFAFSSGEKIGVVGRSGAGKSSLMVLLFRLHEATQGRILVGGVDIATVGLRQLRKMIAIVPQDPLLISGSVKLNLDPFGNHTDVDLRRILEEVQLDASLLSSDSPASNLSQGERQLLTVGRTLLWPASVRVFDEPTSNIDAATDNVIQRLLRSSQSLKGSTQITIAHRLQTVLDCDRILVMSAGRVVEFDAPKQLLADPMSELAGFAKHASADLHVNKPGIQITAI